jgi:hypothetical protein
MQALENGKWLRRDNWRSWVHMCHDKRDGRWIRWILRYWPSGAIALYEPTNADLVASDWRIK